MQNLMTTIGKMIDNTNISLISSVDESGFPNTKAMLSPRKRDGLKHVYFTTNTSSMRVAQYKDNAKACVYFFDHVHFKGVMLRGVMDVLHGTDIKEEIWRPGDEMYYSKGVTDPDY